MSIRMINAFTEEIDEIDAALEELFEQIDLDSLDKNSVALVSCSHDFIETGVIKALADKLPFDLLGMTTMASAINGQYGQYRLALSILTSNNVRFESAYVDDLTPDDYRQRMSMAYKEARAKLDADPAFVVAYFPYIDDVSGEDAFKALDSTLDGVPVFGSLSIGSDMTYTDTSTIYNGKSAIKALALLLLEGEIEPEFVVTAIPERNIRDTRAIVTKSEGCLLQAINEIPTMKYLESLGLTIDQASSSTTPLMVDYGDGSKPVALGIYIVNDDGTALVGGEMPVGTSISIGEIDVNGILETAVQSIDNLLQYNKGTKNAIVFPCVTRYIMLSPNQDAEMEAVIKAIDGELPYVLAYSGGEICPIKDADGVYRNRFHNYSFATAIF